MSLFDTSSLRALNGGELDAAALDEQVVLVVNVASRCGLTPQYEGLERLQQRFGGDAFTVLGAPCNQFGGQEPGTAEEIATFCSTTYGTSFPMTEKLEVNGDGRHALYQRLTETTDAAGEAGDVQWNFEKFLVAADGTVVARFSPGVVPDDQQVIDHIEALLG